ncbi:MAG: phosphoribosylglycinamide formyltransferase [Pseudomonadota bacterium]|nr:phosphoribosylglycinamide formyltransferase [Pseudomonadota bacterium]
MRALIEHSLAPGAAYSVSAVIAHKADAEGINTARDLGIAARALPRVKGMDGIEYDHALGEAIDESSPALIALAGFMHILSAPFVQRYAGRVLNVHPSLLPKYPGLHTHQRALDAREREHGVTVHFVTEQLDGGPRVIQARVPVLAGDTEATLRLRVLAREHMVYPRAVDWFCQGRLRCESGKAMLDGLPLDEPVQWTIEDKESE